MKEIKQAQYVKRTQKDCTISFKFQVVAEVERGELSIGAAARKYGIQNSSTVTNWLRKFGTFDWQTQTPSVMKQTPEQTIFELEQKVKLLEKQKTLLEHQLEFQSEKAIFFDMMINLAEKDLNIKIRKKWLPGQSTPTDKKRQKSVDYTCQLFGLSRQSYYKRKNVDKLKLEQAVDLVGRIREIRRAMPRVGTGKLYHLLGDECDVGRDRLFGILRPNHLLVKHRKSCHITTNSKHMFYKHKNLIVDLPIVRPQQVWVSDITYIGKRGHNHYFALVTDAYSKKIVGLQPFG